MKKLIGLLLIVIIGGLLFLGPKKDRLSLVALPQNVKMQIPKSIANVLGQSTQTLESSWGKYYPQKVVENTVKHATAQVSSDAQELILGISTSFVSGQFVNTYKSMTPATQKQVKDAICR